MNSNSSKIQCFSTKGRNASSALLHYSLLLITCQKTTRGFSEKWRVKSEKVKTTTFYRRLSFFGWGTGIRTPVMTESESVALPLGDAPIFSTLCIIAEIFTVVNTYFQLFLKNYSLSRKKRIFWLYIYLVLWYNTGYEYKTSTRGTAG